MSPIRTIESRDEVLRTLRREGPSTVTELMRAAGAERGGRRKYRQLLRVMLREGDVVLDRKGRLSIPKVEPPAGPHDGRRHPRARSSEGIEAGRPHVERAHAPRAAESTDRGARRRSSRSFSGRAAAIPTETSGAAKAVARFEGHAKGFGFVNPTDGQRDVFIPPGQTAGALHGDLVEYRVDRARPDGRREGSIVRIAEARGQRIVGLVTRISPRVEVVPFDARSGPRFHLDHKTAAGLSEGIAVEIEISRAGASKPARLLEVLGPIDRPGVDLEILIRKYDLRVAFPEAVLREARAIPESIAAEETESRTDFSGACVVTIDGETAKDFDDAVSVSPARAGGFDLAVHIADVAHFVRPGSAIDIEARLRGTSVYFPGRAIPMLPPQLSEKVCSLMPGVPRLVQSVVMSFDRKGEIRRVRFADGWIRSRARLTYGRVNALLEEGASADDRERALLPELERMRDLAALLAERRAARGGLDFDLPEPEVVLDALGAAEGVRPASRGPAQRLIEEFMIAANMSVAKYLVERASRALHRVHERPDPAKVEEFSRIAAGLGYRFGADEGQPEPSDFRALLETIAGRPEERILGRLLLRTMALARYSPEPLGHFGLAATDYLHFTSPIRRYPDLIAHRALRIARGPASEDRGASGGAAVPHDLEGSAAVRDARISARAGGGGHREGKSASTGHGRPPHPRKHEERRVDSVAEEDLDLLAADLSRLERNAESAERESLAWKRAEVLAGRLGETMEGTVTSATPLGLFVELDEVFAEGFVPIAALPDDHYGLDPARLALVGQRTREVWAAGRRLRVQVARVDRITQRIELIPEGSSGGGLPAAAGDRRESGPPGERGGHPRGAGRTGSRDAKTRRDRRRRGR